MESEDARPRRRGHARFSSRIAREICRRVAAGETHAAICADPGMPSAATLGRWAKKHPQFGRVYAQARALSGRENGPANSYCPVLAHQVLARVSEGEGLSAIADDPRMPSLRTLFRWRQYEPEFAEALDQARAALAERFSDLGWRLAMEATPETAFLTQVRLKQLRWMTRVLSPRTHGSLKAVEPPQAPEVNQVLFRHFEIEAHPETGHHRVVGYTPDPDTMQPVRDSEGPWKDPIDTFVAPTGERRSVLRRLDVPPPPATDRGVTVREGPQKAGDPEGWC